MQTDTVYRTEFTPVSFLRRSAALYPDKIAVVHGDRRYSYREFEQRVNRLASRLRADGLQKADRVAFLCPNIPAMLEAHFGVPAAGGILVAINTRLNAGEKGKADQLTQVAQGQHAGPSRCAPPKQPQP